MKKYFYIFAILGFILQSGYVQGQLIYDNYLQYYTKPYFDTTNLIGVRTEYKQPFLLNDSTVFDERKEIKGDYKILLENIIINAEFRYLRANYGATFNHYCMVNDLIKTRTRGAELKFYLLGRFDYNDNYETYVIGILEERIKRSVLFLLSIQDYDIISFVEVADYCSDKEFPINVYTYLDEQTVFRVEKHGYDMPVLFFSEKLQKNYKDFHSVNDVVKRSFNIDENGFIQPVKLFGIKNKGDW